MTAFRDLQFLAAGPAAERSRSSKEGCSVALAKMSASDRRLIFECLTAAARGPFFSDADLSILFGFDRRELLGIVARIPRIDDSEPRARRRSGIP
jgi:hypothetical protein